ncbi:alpha/beta-hydrolase [Fistulina hepatica ATCC 64428]|uniref:Alpha/beta-hydrolase n=1 Tax=Fistulina hepatica ATCC 64428 TaxID=1128425 RepID=A0A0D7A9Z7_9AGAR|nr:alpha/beta-hydrolase [Fistulina hepatica ATCC 64428]
MSALRSQPFKALYLTYEVLTTVFIRAPFWTSWRPRASWSLKRAVFVKFLRRREHLSSIVQNYGSSSNHRAIHGKKVDADWIEPNVALVTDTLRMWSTAAAVEPCRIPGYWISNNDKKTLLPLNKKVILACHGGGYTRHSAHPSDVAANVVHGLMKYCRSNVSAVFSVEYRLAPEFPFPAALLDVLAAYDYLVNTKKVAPSDIILEGNGSGGNLALALARYLVENQTLGTLPLPPGGLLLFSPWCDVGDSHEVGASLDLTAPVIPSTSYEADAIAFLGPHGRGAADFNRYISPASLHPTLKIDFKGFPRTMIVAGGAEPMLGQIHTLRDRMVKDLGDELRYEEYPDAFHDFVSVSVGDPERREALKEVAKWIR